ncbi:MAG TPA: tRNA pseudouridine(38-40) synthase TruA [Sporichthya sp.]|nr:tRNA pseudouridine(38-40) synthase TruA [Sporichthya sp.]
MRVRLDIAYDGTDFAGWAIQDGQRTVASELAAALAVVGRLPEPPLLTVAGRTDAGVHARGQVAHVDLPAGNFAAVAGRLPCAPAEALVRRLAGVLPRDVRVRAAAIAPPGFDARFSALSRRYAFRVCDALGGVDPLRRTDVVWHPRDLDVAAMDAAAQALVGEHDFAAYCKLREGQGTVRRLIRFGWSREADGLLIADVEADAFCHHMVRALVGAGFAVGEHRRPPEWPAQVLAGRVKDSAVQVVPAHGLTLEEVRYPADADLAARAAETRRPRG